METGWKLLVLIISIIPVILPTPDLKHFTDTLTESTGKHCIDYIELLIKWNEFWNTKDNYRWKEQEEQGKRS